MEKKKTAKQLSLFSISDVIPLLDEFDREYELKIQKSSVIMKIMAEGMGYGMTSERRMLRSPAVHLTNDMLEPQSFEARPYIISIAKQAIRDNSLIILPTGLGKTYAGILLIIEALKVNSFGKILLLVPTKPLCEQHQSTIRKVLPKLKTEFITGKVGSLKRPQIWEKSHVIIATPETIREEIRKGTIVGNPMDISLILVDEVHHLTGDYAYAPLAKYYQEQNQNILITGFTASPDADLSKLQKLQKLLQISDEQIIARTYNSPDVKPYVFIRFIKPVFLEKGLTEQQRQYKKQLISVLTQSFKRLERISGEHLSDYAYRNNADKVVGVRITAFNSLMEKLQKLLTHTNNPHEKGLAFVDWAMCMKLGNAIDRLHKGMPEFIFFMQKQFATWHKKPNPSGTHFANNPIVRKIMSEIIAEPVREKLRIELNASLRRFAGLMGVNPAKLGCQKQDGLITAIYEEPFNELRENLEKELKKRTTQEQPIDLIVERLIEWSLSSRLNRAIGLSGKLSELVQYLRFEYQEYKGQPKPSTKLLLESNNVRQSIAWLVHYNIWQGKNHPADLEDCIDIGGEVNWDEAWHDTKLNAIGELVDDLQKKQMLIFVKYRDTLRKVIKFLEYKFPNIKIDRLTGTSHNYGDPGMKQTEQEAALQQYQKREIQILVSTSIGEEGLDFPAVDSLIFYEPISDVRRYIQRLGRTARHRHGKVHILVFKDTGEETIYYTSRAEEKSVQKIIQYYQIRTKSRY